MIRVLIVEDQRMAREDMENYIQSSGRYCLAASITNAAMAETVCRQSRCELVLMDVCTEDDESGLVAAEQIKKTMPQIKIIIVTSLAECSFIERAHKAGVESFWYKDAGKEELLEVARICRKVPEFGSDKDFQLVQALNQLKGRPVLVSKTLTERKEEKKEN